MKKAKFKKKMPHATLMYVPNSEEPIKSIRIPLWLPILLIMILTGFVIFTYTSTNALSAIKAENSESMKQIKTLNKINEEQKNKLQALEASASSVKEQLEENTKLLDEVKKAVGIQDN